MRLNCIVVDDEPLAIEVIEAYVDRMDSLNLVGKFRNAIKAHEFLQTDTVVDVIFLDIQMPKLTGIEFLKTIKNPPKVIFTTAYREHALEGFDLEVVDYLLKPISFDRFMKAISRVCSSLKNTNSNNVQEDDFIFFKSDKKMIRVCPSDILYVESVKDYVKIKSPEKEVVTHQKISVLETKLSPQSFIRVHRSFIVNISKIESYSASEIELNGESIPIGRNYKAEVVERLSKIVL
jgi:DNA-binding LytR/AlgR family response regulator